MVAVAHRERCRYGTHGRNIVTVHIGDKLALEVTTAPLPIQN